MTIESKLPDVGLTINESLPRDPELRRRSFEVSSFGKTYHANGWKIGYCLVVDYAPISDEPDTAFARRLTTEAGVAAIPPSVFYHGGDDHRVLRFCFAKNEATLEAAAEKLCRI